MRTNRARAGQPSFQTEQYRPNGKCLYRKNMLRVSIVQRKPKTMAFWSNHNLLEARPSCDHRNGSLAAPPTTLSDIAISFGPVLSAFLAEVFGLHRARSLHSRMNGDDVKEQQCLQRGMGTRQF
jgi:hypothetical protein